MKALGYHMICRLRDNRVIAESAAHRLAIARIVLKIGRAFRLLVFRLVDSHLHFEVAEQYSASMEMARRVEAAICRKLKLVVGFARAFPREIRDQAHLFNAFDYILRQRENHKVGWDARAEASSLPDLLGLRLLGNFTADHVRAMLPRVDREFLLSHFGLQRLEVAEGPLEKLGHAARAAVGLVSLKEPTRLVRSVQRAAVAIAGRRVDTASLAEQLQTSTRTVQRLRGDAVDERVERAVRLQLALHTAIEADERGPFTS